MTLYKRNCNHCGEYYESQGEKFCSLSCRNKGMYKFYCLRFKRWQEKHPRKAKKAQSKGGKIGGKKSIYKIIKIMKKKGTYIKHQSEAGKIGGKRTKELHPNLARNLMKKNITNEMRAKTALKTLKKYDMFRKETKKFRELHPNFSLDNLEKRRKNFPFWYWKIPFDSNQEKEFCKLLVKYKVITRPAKNKNCHIIISGKDVDFLISKKKLFIEYHPWDFNKNRNYYYERRRLLNKNGYSNYSLIIIKSLKEFHTRLLPLLLKKDGIVDGWKTNG